MSQFSPKIVFTSNLLRLWDLHYKLIVKMKVRAVSAERLGHNKGRHAMPMPKSPVPLPRTQFFLTNKTEDDELPKFSSTYQSPMTSSQEALVCRTPPPVSPKRWTVKRSSGGYDSVNGTLEIVKVAATPPIYVNSKPQPPPMPPKPPKQQPENVYEIVDVNSSSDRQKGLTPWNSLCKDLKLRGETEIKIIQVKAEHLYKAIQHYIFLLSEHGGTLKEHTAELLCIADNLDKVSKGTKIAGITGGATTAAGGVAVVAGLVLSPFTMGASLALTAVGVGTAVAGSVTGASAAIANKAKVNQGKKKVEKTFQEYKHLMMIIQDSLKFINEGLEQLKQHDLSVLSEARTGSVKVAKIVQLATTGGASARAIEANSKASGLMEGFALGIDLYLSQEKNDQKQKTSLKSALAKKIRTLAVELNKGLDELKDLFSEHCSKE